MSFALVPVAMFTLANKLLDYLIAVISMVANSVIIAIVPSVSFKGSNRLRYCNVVEYLAHKNPDKITADDTFKSKKSPPGLDNGTFLIKYKNTYVICFHSSNCAQE